MHVGISTDVCAYLYISLHSCLYTCLHTCLCTRLYAFLNTCLHTCLHKWPHTFSSSSSHFAAGWHSSHDRGQIAFTYFSDRPDVHHLASDMYPGQALPNRF